MSTRRPVEVLAATALVLAAAGVAVAATGTIDPPPRIAFVARADNPADALAVGPTAGQLGAPVFITSATALAPATQAALGSYDPDLVIIAGGEAAISAGVEANIETALGLPADKVIRAAGKDRFETAAAIAGLLADYNPAFLPVDATAQHAAVADKALTADDADTRLDSSAFVRTGQRVERTLVCGVDEFRLHPGYEAMFNDPGDPTIGDVISYNYGTWGVNAYQYPESTKIRCTIDLPADSTLSDVDVVAYDSDGYWLPGCTSRAQTFAADGEEVTTLATSGSTEGLNGTVVLDVSPVEPLQIEDAGVLTVDCSFQPMTGGPRGLGYRAVRATVEMNEVG